MSINSPGYLSVSVIPSHVSGRGYKIGPVCVCVSVCPSGQGYWQGGHVVGGHLNAQAFSLLQCFWKVSKSLAGGLSAFNITCQMFEMQQNLCSTTGGPKKVVQCHVIYIITLALLMNLSPEMTPCLLFYNDWHFVVGSWTRKKYYIHALKSWSVHCAFLQTSVIVYIHWYRLWFETNYQVMCKISALSRNWSKLFP